MKMRILHLMMNSAEASGVVTFVRRLSDTIKDSGVESEIFVESYGDLLPETIDADVVHIHGLWRPIFHRMCMKAFEQEVPVVWSPHGMLAPWAMKHKRLKKLVAWWLYQKWDLKCAALIHVTSEQEALWVRDLGIKRPIVVAPLGADLPKANESVGGRSEVERRKVLLFVGRVCPVKALDRLICAFAQVVGSRSEVVGNRWLLRIVGPDEAGHMSELTQLCEKLGLYKSRRKYPVFNLKPPSPNLFSSSIRWTEIRTRSRGGVRELRLPRTREPHRELRGYGCRRLGSS